MASDEEKLLAEWHKAVSEPDIVERRYRLGLWALRYGRALAQIAGEVLEYEDCGDCFCCGLIPHVDECPVLALREALDAE